MDKNNKLEEAKTKLNKLLTSDEYYTQEIKAVGTNGRKVITKKFLKFEKDLLIAAKKFNQTTDAVYELSEIFKNIDDALEYKLEKIVKGWEERKHNTRFLNFDKPEEGRADQ